MKALSRILIAMGCVLLFSLNQTSAQCISTFPYTQDFENFTDLQTAPIACDGTVKGDTADGWTQDQSDDGEWRADTAGTASGATGPGATNNYTDVDPGKDYKPGTTSGIYLYTESSLGSATSFCDGAEINLLSPCFDFSGTASYELEFAYHMIGNDIGSLHVDVLDSNVWVTDIWSATGDQSFNWLVAKVPLHAFNKSQTKIRIRAVMGNGYTSDIAIDAVSVKVSTPHSYDMFLNEVLDSIESPNTIFTPKEAPNVAYKLRVRNYGTSTATGVAIQAKSGNWSHSQSIGSLTSMADTLVTLSKKLIPDSLDKKQITLSIGLNETDGDSSNNSITLQTGLNDSIVGRDDGYVINALGFNTGSGPIGQMLRISQGDTLTAVRFFLNNPKSGDSVKVRLYQFSTTPGNLIASSKTIIVTGRGWYQATFPCDNILSAGEYFVAVDQITVASSITLGCSFNNYIINTGYYWNGTAWVSLTSADFPYALKIRMVFGKINRPTPKIESNDSFCQGQKLVIKGTGGDTYQWSPSANVQFPKNPSTTAQSDTNFSLSLKAWDACGIPSKTVSKNIKVNPKPKGKTIADTAICLGQSITLTASGGTSYTWAGGPKNSSWTVTPTSSESYQVIFDSTNGCRLILNPRVTVQNLQISAMGDTTVCSGTSVQISASGADTYTWVPGGTGASKTVSPSQTTQYVVTGTSSIGCKDNDTVTVSVNQAPDIVLPHDTIVCFGRRFEVEAAGADSFQWLDGPSTAKYSILPILSKYFYVEGFNNNGCSSSDSMYVVVAPVPQVKLREDTVICEETVLELEALTSNQVEFSWSTGDTTRKINVSPKSETTFKVLVKNNGNCSDSADVTIGVDPLPVINFVTELEQGKFTATNSSLHVDEHKWVFGDGEESNNKSPFHKYQDTGTYFVTYTATNNCGSVDTTFRLDNYWVGVVNVQPHLDFKVYPQPANNRLEIKLENSGISELNIQLFDMNGKLILERNNTQLELGYTSIDISNVSVGSYVLRLSNKHRIGRKMILIK